MHGARTRRQTRQSEAQNSAAADSNTSGASGSSAATGKDEGTALKGYVPGASLGIPVPSRTGPETRSATRMTTRANVAPQSAAHAAPRHISPENARGVARQLVMVLAQCKKISEERMKEILEGMASVESDRVLDYLKAQVGDEAIATASQIWTRAATAKSNLQARLRQQNQRTQQNAALMQQGALASMDGVARQAAYSMQGLVGQHGMAATQMQRPPLTRQHVRAAPYGHGLPQQLTQRPDQAQFPQESMGYASVQRTLASTGALPGKRPQLAATGEVAKTLMPSRSETPAFNYTPSSYLPSAHHLPQDSSLMPPPESYLRMQLSSEGRAPTEAPSNKRAAQSVEAQPTTKAARHSKPRRAVEDPSAPDVGDMDAVMEAAISIETEQKALLTDVPKSVAVADGDRDNQLIESDIVNAAAVKARLMQVIRDEGMQLAGPECVDVMVQGMAEKFEAFIAKALKRATHRAATAHINADSDSKKVTSNVRSQLREIKKKQEQRKANKLKEEREKLEQLAETASKKELANNKELAAKIEKVKREKQFNAEAEAANRALSNALGGFGFENLRKQKREREARAAAAAAASKTAPTTAPSSNPTPPPVPSSAPLPTATPPETTPAAAPPIPSAAPNKKQRVEERRPVVLTTKDIISVMTQDSAYAFSPTLYGMLL